MIGAVMMEMPGSDEWFMRQAMKESRKALVKGEVPIGAIVVKDGRVIGRGWNQVEVLKDATAHAEMIALTAARRLWATGGWKAAPCTSPRNRAPCARGHRPLPPGQGGLRLSGRPGPGAAGGWDPTCWIPTLPSTTSARCVPAFWGTNACTTSRNFSVRRGWRPKNGRSWLRTPAQSRMKTGKTAPNKALCICQSSGLTAS